VTACSPTRCACLRELRRVLRPGGVAQVTVWSRDAPRFRGQGAPGQAIDLVVPWKADGHQESRAYHLYTAATLRNDLETAGFAVAALDAVAIAAAAADNLVALLHRK
jgi:SAM-dependent methyltransferase